MTSIVAMGQPFISKSKFLWGLQCPKLLWHAYTAKHLIPEPDVAQQAIYDQGHEVGALAKQLYPDGVEVGENVIDLDETLRLTTEALKLRRPLFEAAFAANGGYCRVDVLVPVRRDEWDIIEVKSTTSVKEVHLHDLAFQSWVLASAGLRVSQVGLKSNRRVHQERQKRNSVLDLGAPICTIALSNIGIGTRKRENNGKKELK